MLISYHCQVKHGFIVIFQEMHTRFSKVEKSMEEMCCCSCCVVVFGAVPLGRRWHAMRDKTSKTYDQFNPIQFSFYQCITYLALVLGCIGSCFGHALGQQICFLCRVRSHTRVVHEVDCIHCACLQSLTAIDPCHCCLQ